MQLSNHHDIYVNRDLRQELGSLVDRRFQRYPHKLNCSWNCHSTAIALKEEGCEIFHKNTSLGGIRWFRIQKEQYLINILYLSIAVRREPYFFSVQRVESRRYLNPIPSITLHLCVVF